MLTIEESESKSKRIRWNNNPSVKDYLGLSNNGMINNEVFPWKDIVIRIKGGDISPLTDYQKHLLTKSYGEINKFVEYFKIKSYVSEDVLETYNSNIGWMLKDIDSMERKIKDDDGNIYAIPFIILLIIIIISAIAVFFYTNHFIIVLLYFIFAFPCVLITSYLISLWMKKRKKARLQREIELSYSRLLAESADELLDEIYENLIKACKQQ